MPTRYLYGTVLTGEAVAANNRGDNLGNTTTLQKVFVGDDLHTSVSAEALRFAFRYRFQLQGLKVNRRYITQVGEDYGPKDLYTLRYADEKHTAWRSEDPDPYVDDDLMGFMNAEAAKQEQESDDTGGEVAEKEAEAETIPSAKAEGKDNKAKDKPTKPKKPKGTTNKRQSPLAVGRAVSLRPYRGEISFNCVSGAKEEGALSLYAAEMHTTEYQYTFALNMNDVVNKANIAHLIGAIVDPPPVAGNHSRFSYDFSPASVIFRLTTCHSPKIQNCFEHDEETRTYSLARLIQRVECGDVPATELVVGGLVASTEFGRRLGKAGARVFPGVLQASQEIQLRVAAFGPPFGAASKNGEEAQP